MIERALWTSASGMWAARTQVDVIAHNLANVNTPGYKAARADFADLVYAAVRVPVAPADAVEGVPVGHGVRVAATPRLWQQGPLLETGLPWDLAIDGPGFFRVADGDEILYTRSGHFRLSPLPDGGTAVVDPGGRPLLLADGRPLVLPQGTREATVSPEGQVSVTLANGQQVVIGTIALAWPATGDALEARGDGLFAYTGAPGGLILVVPGAAGAGTIRQGMLEQANVSPADEMVRLLAAQRAYELNARAIRTADEMMGLVNNLRA